MEGHLLGKLPGKSKTPFREQLVNFLGIVFYRYFQSGVVMDKSCYSNGARSPQSP